MSPSEVFEWICVIGFGLMVAMMLVVGGVYFWQGRDK